MRITTNLGIPTRQSMSKILREVGVSGKTVLMATSYGNSNAMGGVSSALVIRDGKDWVEDVKKLKDQLKPIGFNVCVEEAPKGLILGSARILSESDFESWKTMCYVEKL